MKFTRYITAFCLLLVHVSTASAQDCANVLKIYALDEARLMTLDDYQHENKIGSEPVSIDIGVPRPQKISLVPAGETAYRVLTKLTSGKNKWDVDQIYVIGKSCSRDMRVERTLEDKARTKSEVPISK